MTDWYRRSTWTAADSVEFFARLSRSKTDHHKGQYLRIQAVHLQRAGGAELVRAALELLDLMIEKYPHQMELASAHAQRGQCLRALGELDAALAAFQAALAAQRTWSNWLTDVHLDYGELVLALQRGDLYVTALAVLDEFGADARFPVEIYRASAISALVHEQQGQIAIARTFAQRALEAAAATKSPFRYHSALGLVTDTSTDFHGRLLSLLGGTH